MTTRLLSCLRAQRWRLLQAIFRAHGLPFDSNLSVADAATRLCAHLSRADVLPARWAALSGEARAALVALAEAGGSLGQDAFEHRFGPLSVYRPWQPGSPDEPWKNPRSPADEVLFGGLAFRRNLGTKGRPLWAIVLPDEFHQPVCRLAALPAPSGPGPGPPAPAPLSADLFALLSFLHRQDVRPIRDRWLPPTALRALNAHLSCPGELAGVRSERQAPYIAFLHYLAERAGLVGVSAGTLRPTLLAHAWLALPLPERLQRLWEAWTGGDIASDTAYMSLWVTYRLPGWKFETVAQRFQRLLAHLARRAPGHAQPTAGLLDALIASDPPLFRITSYAHWADLSAETQAHFQGKVRRVLASLLSGPLTWFGILGGEPLALTPLGAALLGREDGAWPADPSPEPLIISPQLAEGAGGEPAVLLTAPPGLPLPQRLALEALVPPDPEKPGVYPLTRERVLQVLQKGGPVSGGDAAGIAGLLNQLEGAAREPLPPAVHGALYRWAAEHERLRIRQILVLEAQEAGLLQELARARRIRETLGETLSARAVRVYADRLPALLRRLAARGCYPHLDLAGWTLSPADREGEARDEGTIVAALRIYAALAGELNLPFRPPDDLIDACTEALSLPQRDAVERTVAQVLDRLRQAATPPGEYRLPVPAGPLLSRLERAIADRATVEIRYYTAGRGHETRRRIDPLRLEWRGSVAYLIAHCHLRGEQRVFRVDRIAALRAL